MGLSAGAGTALGAGVSALGNLINSGISYRKQKKLLKRQQDFAHSERLEAEEYQRRMWHETFNAQNAYNDPSAVMARLKSAGLNPDLYYGGNAQFASQGGATLSSSVGHAMPVTPVGEASSIAGFESIGNLAKEISTINLQDSQKDLNREKAETEKTIQLRNGVEMNATASWTNAEVRRIETTIDNLILEQGKIQQAIATDKSFQDLNEHELKERISSFDDRMKSYYLDNEKKLSEIGLNKATLSRYNEYMDAFIVKMKAETGLLYGQQVGQQYSNEEGKTRAFKAKEELKAIRENIAKSLTGNQRNLFEALVDFTQASYENDIATMQKQLQLLEDYGDAAAITDIVSSAIGTIVSVIIGTSIGYSTISKIPKAMPRIGFNK